MVISDKSVIKIPTVKLENAGLEKSKSYFFFKKIDNDKFDNESSKLIWQMIALEKDLSLAATNYG